MQNKTKKWKKCKSSTKEKISEDLLFYELYSHFVEKVVVIHRGE